MPLLRNIRNQVKGFSWGIKGTTNNSDHSETQTQLKTKKGDKLEEKRTKKTPTEFYISKELFKLPLECFQRWIPLILIQEVTTNILKFSQLYPKQLSCCSGTFVTTRNRLIDKRASTQRSSYFSVRTTSQETSRIRKPQEEAPSRLTIPDLPSVSLGYGKALLTASLRIAY